MKDHKEGGRGFFQSKAESKRNGVLVEAVRRTY